jgi:arylsulfatase B/arylsulfatase I/J
VFGLLAAAAAAATAPNILMIIADDYGWNDVGYHGSELSTPEIDALAAEGVKLENYYVLPVCTPTRSAMLSARYPLRTGLQTSTISPAKPYGLHLNYSTLADELQARGYATHALGKWYMCWMVQTFPSFQS